VKYPQIIVLENDSWLGKQLRDLAAESRWLIHSVRTSLAVLSQLQPGNPTVILLQIDLGDEHLSSLNLIREINRLEPDSAVIVVSDVKVSDSEQSAWTAALFDLGARYVLFPPLTKPVLEDVVSGLMTVSINRLASGKLLKKGSGDKVQPLEEVIDLADRDTQA
jgi:DNA-binding response OmpR family regulator